MLREMGTTAEPQNSLTLAAQNNVPSFISNQTYAVGASPFMIKPAIFDLSLHWVNGMPTVNASAMNKIPNHVNDLVLASEQPYLFFYDLWASDSFIFETGCQQINQTNGTNSTLTNCTSFPVLASNLSYTSPYVLSSKTKHVSQGGYDLQGTYGSQSIAFNTFNNHTDPNAVVESLITVLNVDGVLGDAWLYGQQALSG